MTRWADIVGQTYGQYKVIEQIGRGGGSVVFRAYDVVKRRPVAFKAIPVPLEDQRAFQRRFVNTAEIVSKLRHPNIAQVYDAGETDEFVFLVMRLVEGGTLRRRLASPPLGQERMPTQEVCKYIVQIARALEYAHQQGVIHRDVNLSRMLLDTEQPEHIALTGFDSTQMFHARGLTTTGAIASAPECMSPEQAEGRELDRRSDIYSLGCVLYEMLAGRPPFVGSSLASILYQQVYASPTYIRSYNAEVPREMWAILRACLAKRPEDRYDTAGRLADELQPFADGLIQSPSAGCVICVPRRLDLYSASQADARHDD